jgi:hypothetical protein
MKAFSRRWQGFDKTEMSVRPTVACRYSSGRCRLAAARRRHCPKCQGAAPVHWLADRQAELLPVPYFHVVFTMPALIAAIAFQNKGAVYAILFKTAVEAMTALTASPFCTLGGRR